MVSADAWPHGRHLMCAHVLKDADLFSLNVMHIQMSLEPLSTFGEVVVPRGFIQWQIHSSKAASSPQMSLDVSEVATSACRGPKSSRLCRLHTQSNIRTPKTLFTVCALCLCVRFNSVPALFSQAYIKDVHDDSLTIVFENK